MKVNITIPILNEGKILESSVNKLINFLKISKFPYKYEIVIADNASTDNTAEIGKKLEKKYKQVKYSFIPKRGKGIAIKNSWKNSSCDILSFMDTDLSTDLRSFPPLIEAIAKRKGLVSIGSRLDKRSKTIGRPFVRELLSKCYNRLIYFMFFPKFKDAQCGFKAINQKYFKEIEPLIKNNKWFFDTELLLITTKFKKKIISIPVLWTDYTDSRVKLGNVIQEDLKGLIKVKMRFLFNKKYRK